MDWDKGLPTDVLVLVANAGRFEKMKAMRGVCKSWQLGFELGVTGISLNSLYPLLPEDGTEAARRFPMLCKLGLGKSKTNIKQLEALKAFPRLASLALGSTPNIGSFDPWSTRVRVDDASLSELIQFQGLTHLDLSWCIRLTDLGALGGVPSLTSLDLQGCKELTPEGPE